MSLPEPQSVTVESGQVSDAAKSYAPTMRLSVVGLILGLLALGFAVIPPLATARAFPNPFESPEEAQRRIAGPPLRQGGIGFKIKGFEIRFGGKEVKDPAVPPPFITDDPLRWFLIAASVCGFVGLAVAAVAQIREMHTVLTATAMTCCVAAITWQFIMIGMVIGIAAAIFVLVVARFG